MIQDLNNKVNAKMADDSDPYRLSTTLHTEAVSSDAIQDINDENTSIQHLGQLEQLANAEEKKVQAELKAAEQAEKQRKI